MPKLRRALRAYLAGWRDDVPPAWRAALDGVEPALDKVRDDLLLHEGEVIYPGRRGHAIDGAPPGSHLFRALDGLAPADVRVVVVGQDPYPLRSQATGRAFEQGDLREWPRNHTPIAASLARIIQCVAAARTGDPAYVAGDGAWARVHADVAALRLQPPGEIFDHWERQGVLFLNAGLTLSHFAFGGAPEQKSGHIPLWRPVVSAIFRHLPHAVFALWGRPARDAFTRAGATGAVVEHAHPNAWARDGSPSFFVPPNPLVAINQRLGPRPIDW